MCEGDNEFKELVACRVLQETQLGHILLDYVDKNDALIINSYLRDLVHMMHKPSCLDNEELQHEYQVFTSVCPVFDNVTVYLYLKGVYGE